MGKKGFFHRGVFIACALLVCVAAAFVTPELRTGVPLAVFLAAVSAALLLDGDAPLPSGRPARIAWAGLSLFTALYFSRRLLLRLGEAGLSGRAALLLRAASLLLAVPCLYFCLCAFAFLIRRSGQEDRLSAAGAGAPTTRGERLFLLLIAGCVITVCSKSSPLYPFNDWVDANCFLTVGKSMLRGQVLYRDIYEQKGVLLYALHSLASLISFRSFLGVWLLEIAAAYGFLFYFYKAARLFASRRCLWLTPLLAGMLYSMRSFCHGDSAEELCLPLLMFALYTGMRALRSETELTRREWFFIGLTSGCVLWIKFSLLGFYPGWVLVLLWDMLRKKHWRSLADMMAFLLLGIAAVTLPVLGYFALHGALGDLFQSYFYNNLFLYSRDPSLFQLRRNVGRGLYNSTFLYLSILFSLVWLIGKRDLRLAGLYILSLGFLMFTSLNSVHPMRYYTFAFSPFAVFFLPLCDSLLPKETPRQGWLIGTVSAALAAVLIFFNSTNLYLLSYRQEDMPQFKFAEILSRREAPTLLNYGFLDGGFYTVAGIVPNCRYFCELNIPLEDMYTQEDACLREGRTEFVVTRDRELDAPLYRCVAQETFPYEGYSFVYRLYMRNDLPDV